MNNALSDFIFQSKYSRYNAKLGRKETWEESVSRIDNMHVNHLLDNYPDAINSSQFNEDYLEAMQAYKDKKLLGSQRGLQFGGDPILKKNCRLFNCSFTYADRLDIFKEIEWVLLCGAGAGLSVERQHVNKLPRMVDTLSTSIEDYIIEDSIEGWSLAIDRLVRCFFDSNLSYPKFDYTAIRPNGSLISGGFVAPGPEGLKKSIQKIEELLNKVYKTTKVLSPLNVTDIISHEADSVLSGGVRRSALIILFDPDDVDMFTCKTGNWFYENPQRARFNMSAVLERDGTSREVFDRIFKSTKEFGEPGFFWRSNKKLGCNPCQPAWATVLTPKGIRTFADIDIGDRIWSSEGWSVVTDKWSTGIKQVKEYRTTCGVFYGTENHRLVFDGKKVEAKDCVYVDSLLGLVEDTPVDFDYQAVMDGMVVGTGYVYDDEIFIPIGAAEFFDSPVIDYIVKARPDIDHLAYEVETTLTPDEVHDKAFARIPDRYMFADRVTKLSFLHGLYSAAGEVFRNAVLLRTSSWKLREQVQVMLSSLGIQSFYITKVPSPARIRVGARDMFHIRITTDRELFCNLIGFIQQDMMDRITIIPTTRKRFFKILSIRDVSVEEVFDITVDNHSHTYWTGGLNVSNCAEIGFDPTYEGKTGFQFCNLVTINGSLIETEEDFYKACKNATTLATVQATYNKFPFLGETTENLIKQDPLIGVSIGGIMNSPKVLLDPVVLRKGAEIIKEQNAKIAGILGINVSSRCTCIKPEYRGSYRKR